MVPGGQSVDVEPLARDLSHYLCGSLAILQFPPLLGSYSEKGTSLGLSADQLGTQIDELSS